MASEAEHSRAGVGPNASLPQSRQFPYNQAMDYDSAWTDEAAATDDRIGADRDRPLNVSQVNAIVRGLIDDLLPQIWISGEISNLKMPGSGHVYFSLKDDQSTIRAVLWQSTASKLKFRLQDGMQVVGQGKVDVYAKRGEYQVVFRSLQPVGEGALQLALRQLYERLSAEGLFDRSRKKPLPRFPRRIGFVTSPSGAAIRDFARAIRVRWPLAEVLVIPTLVQGPTAELQIAKAIGIAASIRPSLDVLIVGRGGGSVEDLWCFNTEGVVRAVAACPIPTISAVGHEIDVTLADHAADVRALTPTDAATQVVPDLRQVEDFLRQRSDRLLLVLGRRVAFLRQRLDSLLSRPVFRRPQDVVLQRRQAVDELQLLLDRIVDVRIDRLKQRLDGAAGKLDAISPLATLARGYSVTRTASGHVVGAAEELAVDQEIETLLASGQFTSRVTNITPRRDSTFD